MEVAITHLLWFCLGATLPLLIRMVKWCVFRIAATKPSMSTYESEPLQKITEDDETRALKLMIERLGEEEENSGTEFKFSFHFPDDIIRRSEGQLHDSNRHKGTTAMNTVEEHRTPTSEEAPVLTTTAAVDNYRFLAEKNIRSFVVLPETVICSVQESFTADSELRFSRVWRNSDGCNHKVAMSSVKKGEGVLPDEPKDEEAVCPNEEHEVHQLTDNDKRSFKHDNSNTGDRTIDLLDRELRGSEKTVTDKMEEDRVRIFGEIEEDAKEKDCTVEEKSGPEESSSSSQCACHEVNDKKSQFNPDVVSGYGRETSFTDCFLSGEDFGGNGLDSVSVSTGTSDGYSVKILVIDADSDDGFLSEGDFGGSGEVNLDEEENHALRIEQKRNEGMGRLENHDAESLVSRTSDDPTNYSENDEEDDSKKFDEVAEQCNRVIEEANLVISRLCSSVERIDDISPPDIRSNDLDPPGGVRSEECSDELEKELNDLERAVKEIRENSIVSQEEGQVLGLINSDDRSIGTEDVEMPSSFVAEDHDVESHSDQSVEKHLLEYEDTDEEKNEEEEVFLRRDIPYYSKTIDHGSEHRWPKVLGNDSEEEEFMNTDTRGKDSDKEETREEESPQNLGKSTGAGKGEFDELEALWEHQDLIEKLSEELMYVRSTGLETIQEEPRSPNLVAKLGDWKFDAVFLHEKPKDELQAFYKIYRERMRKLDILNYQKMYTVDFLRPKNPQASLNRQKPTVTSLLTQNILLSRRRRSINERRTEELMKELHAELENVYVSQTCLSWEFLWWQYEKAQELPKPDRYGWQQYNRVAGEFQHFHVLIRRFLEDNPFQVGRVPHYVKSRREHCDILQVPLIKEDSRKDKAGGIKNGNDAIMFEDLKYIVEKSIKIFWQFVKTDEDETPTIVKGLVGTQVELQDPTDVELMQHVQRLLHKKDRKLKEILRVRNCLVKKLKRPEEARPSKDTFFSQVDLKLIARVLRMPRLTTDQLVWCHNKLCNITFEERNIQRETAFLPFPCST